MSFLEFDKSFFQKGAFLVHQGQIFWSSLQDSSGDFSSGRVEMWDFFLTSKRRLFYGNFISRSVDEFLFCLEKDIHNDRDREDPQNIWEDIRTWKWQGPSREHFFSQWKNVKDWLERAMIQKAVIIGCGHTMFFPQGVVLKQLIKQLLKIHQTYSQSWAYGIWFDSQGVLGLTPEVLFEKHNVSYQTMALAGTRPYCQKERLALDQDKKEQKEHQIVINDLIDKLEPIAKVKVKPTEVIQFPHMEHLRTYIEFYPDRDLSVETLISYLHPTAAMGIYPLNSHTMNLLKQLPGHIHRGYFGAPLVFIINANHWIAPVLIRGLFWNREKGSSIYAGVGIVKESQLEREWDELVQKINMVSQMLFEQKIVLTY